MDTPTRFDESRTDLKPYGLGCELWQPKRMKREERHNELEINFLPDCSITYLISNRKFKIKRGTVIAFWALMPHQVIDFKKDCPYYVITIPFSVLHEWNLPKTFLDSIFKGEVQITRDLEDIEFEKKRFDRWSLELDKRGSELYAACSLEICAFIKRLALKNLPQSCEQKVKPPPINLVERMAMFIASNFTEPIKASDVAREVGLHPDYANSIFKKAFCKTISNYIIGQRVLYAERKLSISDEPITSLAFQSGFSSISRFNAAFKKKNKLTPREYRKRHLLTLDLKIGQEYVEI
ncbi:helix-turn-helix domain-containing protein [Allomuricauda sp. CP2A]|jgi:AraC-like DNA-binding protein|uniref:helix-turn-helix domain-containing protein n=1 Tax=Allomuricauda sp. CP2A TaxID=1848189 RepID=UPI0008325340|nr:helix-turn-helix domain-containing protein [Muricauda sp. CP2A]